MNNDLSQILIKDCSQMSPRGIHALARAGYHTLWDVHQATNQQLRRHPRIGAYTVIEVRSAIKRAQNIDPIMLRTAAASRTSETDIIRWALKHADIIRALMTVIA